MSDALSAGLAAYRERLGKFNEIAERMGEMAALLADVADMLSHHPQRFAPFAGEWPSRADLDADFGGWGGRHAALLEAWSAMSDRDRILAGSLPRFDAPDPSLPLV